MLSSLQRRSVRLAWSSSAARNVHRMLLRAIVRVNCRSGAAIAGGPAPQGSTAVTGSLPQGAGTAVRIGWGIGPAWHRSMPTQCRRPAPTVVSTAAWRRAGGAGGPGPAAGRAAGAAGAEGGGGGGGSGSGGAGGLRGGGGGGGRGPGRSAAGPGPGAEWWQPPPPPRG